MDMSDLVEKESIVTKLRREGIYGEIAENVGDRVVAEYAAMCNTAADEIERLTAVIERLTAERDKDVAACEMELIERLEQATEGSRELDKEIWLLSDPKNTREKFSYTHTATGKVCKIDETRDATHKLIVVPRYTTSIDAALTLVPKGWEWGRDQTGACFVYEKTWPMAGKGPRMFLSDCPTPALALCIAALKARERSLNG